MSPQEQESHLEECISELKIHPRISAWKQNPGKEHIQVLLGQNFPPQNEHCLGGNTIFRDH